MKYKKFQKRIRKIISDYATLDSEEEEAVKELGFLFSDVSDLENDTSDRVERGEKLLIRDGAFKRKINSASPGDKKSSEDVGGDFGAGKQGGTKTKTAKGGNIRNPEGVTPIRGQAEGDTPKSKSKYSAKNLGYSP